jgi:hypothetical protein
MYGDKEQKPNVGIRGYLEFIQGYHGKNKSVEHMPMDYGKTGDGWAARVVQPEDALSLGMQPKIKPFTLENGMFDTIDVLFDRAVDIEIEPNRQAQYRQPESSHWQKDGKKRNLRLFIVEPVEPKKLVAEIDLTYLQRYFCSDMKG